MCALGSGHAGLPRLSSPPVHTGRLQLTQVHRCVLACSPCLNGLVAAARTLLGDVYTLEVTPESSYGGGIQSIRTDHCSLHRAQCVDAAGCDCHALTGAPPTSFQVKVRNNTGCCSDTGGISQRQSRTWFQKLRKQHLLLLSQGGGGGSVAPNPTKCIPSNQLGLSLTTKKKTNCRPRYAWTSAERQPASSCCRSSANPSVSWPSTAVSCHQLSVNRRRLTDSCHRQPQARPWWEKKRGEGISYS